MSHEAHKHDRNHFSSLLLNIRLFSGWIFKKKYLLTALDVFLIPYLVNDGSIKDA